VRFVVRYDPRRYLYYVYDNSDGAVVSARLDYDRACVLSRWLNKEDNEDA